jgi:hypothetical protein
MILLNNRRLGFTSAFMPCVYNRGNLFTPCSHPEFLAIANTEGQSHLHGIIDGDSGQNTLEFDVDVPSVVGVGH